VHAYQQLLADADEKLRSRIEELTLTLTERREQVTMCSPRYSRDIAEI